MHKNFLQKLIADFVTEHEFCFIFRFHDDHTFGMSPNILHCFVRYQNTFPPLSNYILIIITFTALLCDKENKRKYNSCIPYCIKHT